MIRSNVEKVIEINLRLAETPDRSTEEGGVAQALSASCYTASDMECEVRCTYRVRRVSSSWNRCDKCNGCDGLFAAENSKDPVSWTLLTDETIRHHCDLSRDDNCVLLPYDSPYN
ncbi:hypothetical protein EAI_05787 [Harpegnathos saltator]|uniref:Uncharacterized protein n=1 Tax=Harpegnathos saltator TaxID=610380 RepID=E2BTB9_HARSA|nr:hypothetical protein EAI_05787 [Harpegnathos saltator]